jgi:hypothetical protein
MRASSVLQRSKKSSKMDTLKYFDNGVTAPPTRCANNVLLVKEIQGMTIYANGWGVLSPPVSAHMSPSLRLKVQDIVGRYLSLLSGSESKDFDARQGTI